MSEKLQMGIYQIKKDFIDIVKGKKHTHLIDVNFLSKLFKSKGYNPQKVQTNLDPDFEIYLYYKRSNSAIKWKDFIKKVVEPEQAILKYNNSNSESYILLLLNLKSKTQYATTGGFGHTALQGIVENDYGLDILSRIVNAQDRTLRSTKEKNLTGGILGSVKFFRNDYNLNENDSFGNFYQELHSSLNKKLLTDIFGFSQYEIDSECLCIAKNSFTIKKSISFDQLITIIKKCEHLIKTTKPVVEINGVKKLNKTNKVLIQELEKELEKSIFENYTGLYSDISIELCHKEFDKYLHADNFLLKYKIGSDKKEIAFDQPLRNILEVINKIKEDSSTLSKEKIHTVISNSYIISQTTNGEEITSDLLKNHYYTEIQFNNINYFLSDNEWYEIKPSFTQKLNEQCQTFINENRFLKQLKDWDFSKESENDFNAKHIGENEFLVFDRFTPENIEACDILHWDKENIFFIHVKAGFDNSMRDLSHQLFIAGRRVKEDTKTGYSFMRQLYNDVSTSNGTTAYSKKAKNQLKSITERDFINLFKTRKPIFVLAVFDTAKQKRELKNIHLYGSNIAKFSLQELVKNMRTLAIDFQICEIK